MERQTRSKATTPAAVSQALSDLLQTFPAAATTGVQWQTLERKYEERYGAAFDIAALGYSTSLAAASALLWDVMRLVDGDDVDNPVVAIESNISLTARPGYLACWPSLYSACCDIVQDHGSADGGSRSLLLSQLKPFLQKSWHSSFTESGFGYFTEQGKFVSLKKMKHLVTAMLRWRQEHLDSPQFAAGRLKNLRSVLTPTLELEQSKTHNDWLLRITPQDASTIEDTCQPVAAWSESCQAETETTEETELAGCGKMLWSDIDTCELDDRWSEIESRVSSPSSRGDAASSSTLREIAALRAENERLRSETAALQRSSSVNEEAGRGMFFIPATFRLPDDDEPDMFDDMLDDPFEPPPQKRMDRHWSFASSTVSPGPSDFSWSAIGTPGASSTSGAATPAMLCQPGQMPPTLAVQACAFVPVAMIPSGIVKQARSFFERADSAIPSFFVQQS
eukprot:TRINITY_DN7066_c0_g1_i1.p1 TRINITY_DN7066_c0_g1~~TRINITY_DN7066_c0_g1_i1.p1  ORF type:complete len:451 (+),score=75.40 TRINITY_DN7066_c0_g1_i1:78-1430(+)